VTSSRLLPIGSAVACGVVLSACGGGGGDSAKTFEAPDVAFSFKYPASLTQQNEDDGKVLAQVLPEPGDTANAIKVRKTSDRELQLGPFVDEIHRKFVRQLGRVDKRTERHSDIEMHVLSFRTPTTLREGGQSKKVTVSSASYIFTGGDKTWQLECLSTEAHRAQIDAACRQAIDSISF
jgi:hypothetical protein